MKTTYWQSTLCVFSLFWGTLLNGQTIKHDDPKGIKAALADIQEHIQKLEKSLYQNQHQEKNLIQQLATIEKEMGEHADKERVLIDKQAQHTAALNALKKELRSLEAIYEKHQAALIKLLRSTYHHHHKEKWQLLLEPNEWSTLSRINQYYHFFFEARAEKLKDLEYQLHAIKELHAKMSDEQQMLMNLASKIQQNKKALMIKKVERQEILNTLIHQVGNAKQQLAQFKHQEQQLETLFKSIQQKLNHSPRYIEPTQNFTKMKHRLLLPIQRKGTTFSSLPHQKTLNTKKTYISAPLGTPVTGIFPGRVVFAEWLRAVGLLIIIDHGNGYLSLYGNNQKLYKSVGEWVEEGEMIARVGQSGGHAEPGLYFEIRKNGEALDPTPWFIAMHN